jgi:hypothetical protein
MNKDKLRKMQFHRVRLRPIVRTLTARADTTPQDDDWIIEEINDLGVRVKNMRTDHSPLLGFDHIHNYTTDSNRDWDGAKHGFLILTVQLYLDGWNVQIEPKSFDD